jgi:hypothetical protein
MAMAQGEPLLAEKIDELVVGHGPQVVLEFRKILGLSLAGTDGMVEFDENLLPDVRGTQESLQTGLRQHAADQPADVRPAAMDEVLEGFAVAMLEGVKKTLKIRAVHVRWAFRFASLIMTTKKGPAPELRLGRRSDTA